MTLCVVKEEVDLPFNEDDLFGQQIAVHEIALADSTTDDYPNFDSNIKVKSEEFPMVLVKTEPSNDEEHLLSIDIKNEPSDEVDVHDSLVNGDLDEMVVDETIDEKFELRLEEENSSGTESDDENHIAITKAMNIELIREALKIKTAVLKIKRLSVQEILEHKRKNAKPTKKIIAEKSPEEVPIAEQLPAKKRRTHNEKSRFSLLIRQQCSNCDVKLEGQIQVIKKCHKCEAAFVYICIKCDKQYTRKQSIKNHLDTKCHPLMAHSCQLCDYTSNKYDHMKRHVLGTHRAKFGNLLKLIKSVKVQ